MRLVRAFVLVLTLAAPVHAIPIEGFISGAVLTSDMRPFFRISGDGFSIRKRDAADNGSGPTLATR